MYTVLFIHLTIIINSIYCYFYTYYVCTIGTHITYYFLDIGQQEQQIMSIYTIYMYIYIYYSASSLLESIRNRKRYQLTEFNSINFLSFFIWRLYFYVLRLYYEYYGAYYTATINAWPYPKSQRSVVE